MNQLEKISDWLRIVSKGWVVLLTLVIFLLFTALVLPGQASKAELESNSAGSPDLSFFYSGNDLYRMAGAYGEAGREAYIRARFTYDLIWPLVYALFLTTGISWLWGRVLVPESLWQRINLVPILAALFDYFENSSTSLVMAQYPNRLPLLAMLAPIFTMGKWLLVGGSFVLLLFGVGAVTWKWAKLNFGDAAGNGF